jgi:uncharacterized membrane protein YqjE
MGVFLIVVVLVAFVHQYRFNASMLTMGNINFPIGNIWLAKRQIDK